MENVARPLEVIPSGARTKGRRRELVSVRRSTVRTVRPKITANHRLEDNSFYIEIDLRGANKETVKLEMGTYGLSVKARGDRLRYYGDLPLGYNIVPERAKANYEDEVLRISLPLKERTLAGTEIDITM